MKAILVAVASALLLAGCTLAPQPTPTEASCNPSTADFSWEASSQGENQPVGVQVLTYSDSGATHTMTVENIAVEAFLQDGDVLNLLTDFDQNENAKWMKALLTDVQRTGQVSEKFNTNPDLDQKLALPEKPTDGTYVVLVQSPQVTVPFTISCDGELVAQSALTSTDPFGFASVAYRCGDDYGDDPTVAIALEYCP